MDTAENENRAQRFRRIYEVTFDKLYRIFLQSLKSEELTRDILQEAYLKLWYRMDELDGRQDHFPFLYFHARNHARKEINRKMKQDLAGQTLMMKEDDTDLSAEFDKKEFQSVLKEIIDKLPAKRKLVYQMFKEEGLSYKTIAKILNISIKTVDNHLNDANKTIKKQLKSNYGSTRWLFILLSHFTII
ncbi:RNA polymerase ECF-type sigma factor [Arcticibacter svalbardensis MN12-7]|uniref:RNA polymerase ECF-type sigma factor n=1 Tax=Arcticibacter svalbardensis MN12-7 TaxID=1150600 RepID=R9H539_9SPHI|nr:sigma-70 family RNA polymerase sigma factor [Arcticibacter svalbardensis]EOR96289.1 RNA polymerase ECF-type sigma factor [Arcticibacter svalbardensis MN12-7]